MLPETGVYFSVKKNIIRILYQSVGLRLTVLSITISSFFHSMMPVFCLLHMWQISVFLKDVLGQKE